MDQNNKHQHHLVPFRIYYFVWAGLMIFTVITVAASYIDFGMANITIAFLIATVKAMLVILFFMGLRYDGMENNVSFFLSFLFLAIFISLTASDEFFRKHTEFVRVEKPDPSEAGGAGPDLTPLLKPTPDLVSQGKTLYAQNCAACHGADGKGDGPAAASLNPKPRNLTSDQGWKVGRTVSKLYRVITDGIPGTPMPPFSGLGEKERLSLTHFIRTLMASPPVDTSAELASLGKGALPAKPRVPIQIALERMVEPSVTTKVAAIPERKFIEKRGGEGLYFQNCMSCHASAGQGGVEVQSVGVNPPLRVVTRPLFKSVELSSLSNFQRFVAEGIPGRGMPGFAKFTSEQWQELYRYVKNLQ